jgi:hypothetical protein
LALKNILLFAVSYDGGRTILLQKCLRRFEILGSYSRTPEALAFYAENASRYDDLLESSHPDLWNETTSFCASLKESAQTKLTMCLVIFGGADAIDFLYFLVRFKRPKIVLETGVAAGWTSASILHAMELNREGRLFSSDFPYFRQSAARQHIGLLVENLYYPRWQLLDDGYSNNLPRLLEMMDGRIDIFHYDSDKSYAGRSFAYRDHKR